MQKKPEVLPGFCAYQGRYGRVWFFEFDDIGTPSRDFYDGLREGQKAKFMALFTKITSDPHLRLRNRQQFRQVSGDLYEFKRNDLKMRLFTFRRGDAWILLAGLKGKKEDKLPGKAVGEALALLDRAKRQLGA